MSIDLDIPALKAKLAEYNPDAPRCLKHVKSVLGYLPGNDEPMCHYDACARVEGHPGECRSSRLVLGWPGYKTLTALIHEIEDLRMLQDEHMIDSQHAFDEGRAQGASEMREQIEHARSSFSTARMLEREKERAAVVAWLRANTCGCHDFASAIERGDHRQESKK